MAQASKRRTGLRLRSVDSGQTRESPVLTQAVQAHVTLVNITREQVQVRGGGSHPVFGPYEFLMSPGVIGKPGTSGKGFRDSRNCILHMKSKVAVRMARRRKAYLRVLPLKDGRALEVRAKALVPQYGEEAFFRALGELYPKWVMRNDVDEAREARERRRLVAQFKQNIGEPPDESWSNARIAAAIKNVAGAFASSTEAAGGSDIFDIFGAPVEGAMIRDGMVVDEPTPFAPDEDDDDEEEVDILSTPVQKVATTPEEAELIATRNELTRLGVQWHHLHKLPTLQKLLKNKIAALAANQSATG